MAERAPAYKQIWILSWVMASLRMGHRLFAGFCPLYQATGFGFFRGLQEVNVANVTGAWFLVLVLVLVLWFWPKTCL